MALASFSSRHHIFVHRSNPVGKPIGKALKLKHSQFPIKKEPSCMLVTRSSLRKEVFENPSEGIICYTDDKGELICEGYDEGPRFLQRLSRTSYDHTRDAEIVNLIQQRLLQIVNGGEFSNADTDAVNYSLQDDHNFNGFHRFCSSNN